MRWATKPLPAIPKQGTQRHVKRFAFWPKRTANDTTVWLETYWKVQEWDCRRDFFNWPILRWHFQRNETFGRGPVTLDVDGM